MTTSKNKGKKIKAYAVLTDGKLLSRKGEWVIPIMRKKINALGYSFGHKKEEVVPVEILIPPKKN